MAKYFLFFLFTIQIIMAIPAGLSMIADPSGSGLGLPIEMLKYSPFENFLIPGLFLFFVLGIFPIMILHGLMKKPMSARANKFNINKGYNWSWCYAFYFGLLLILWINVQLLFIKEYHIFHFITVIGGIIIVIITQLPGFKMRYKE